MASKANNRIISFILMLWFLPATYLTRTWVLMDEFYISRFVIISIGFLLAFFFYKNPIKDKKVDLIIILLSAYYFFSLISLCWAVTPSAGFLQLQTVFIFLLSYLYFKSFLPEYKNFLLGTTIQILTLIVLVFGFLDVLKYGVSVFFSETTLYAIKGYSAHKNLLSSYLFLLLGFNLVYYTESKKKWLLPLMGSQVIFIFLLQSRAVFIALFLFGLIFFSYLILMKNKWRILIKVVVVFIVVIAMFSVLVPRNNSAFGSIIHRYNPVTYFTSFSGSERILIWYKTTDLIKENWVKGYGIGNWKIVLPSKGLDGSYRMQSKQVIFTRVHNDFLEVWAETGIFGLLFFTSLFLIPIIFLLRYKNRSLTDFILIGILVGYAVISFFDFPKERIEHQVLFGLLLAFITCKYKKNIPAFGIPDHLFKPINLLLFIGLFFNLVYGWYHIKGEYYNRKGLFADTRNDWIKAKENFNLAYSDFYKISPIGVSLKWRVGLADYHLGNFNSAATNFAAALNDTPHHFSLLNDYASTLVQLGKYDLAEELYYKVLKINPKYEDALFNLSFTLSQLKKYDEALFYLNKTTTQLDKKKLFEEEIKKLMLSEKK